MEPRHFERRCPPPATKEFEVRGDRPYLGGEAVIRRALEETGRFLVKRRLQNVFVDLMHEYNHPERIDHPLLREPDGAAKKAKLTAWFKAVAPAIEVGVCPTEDSGTADEYPGMDVRLIQKSMPIPARVSRPTTR